MNRTDVIILGGGLAGLTLALQLRARLPSLGITVLERRRWPVPEAAHKVGESTVEIGADYLANVVGLREHLQGTHLKKFGFRFFFSEQRRELDQVTELGASDYLRTPGYQIDRGLLENHLAERARRSEVQVLGGAIVRHVTLRETGEHEVRVDIEGQEHELKATWVVDASGRAGLLRQQMALKVDNGHHANAIWFRLNSRLKIDDWCQDAGWQARCVRPERWLSTNHLVGRGYWVWLIPLVGGAHSVGIVADAALHPLREMNSFERALAWLGRHQPRLAEEVAEARGSLLDFVALRHFSYGCRQVFSEQRWALTGEAGLFLDPFYSPGTDFIAIANTYITDLIARQQSGEAIGMRAGIYQKLFLSFYDSTLDLYRGQYGIFGHAEAMSAKVLWDYTYYWGVLAHVYFQRRLTDLASLGAAREQLTFLQALNREVQGLLRTWADTPTSINAPRLLDQASLPWFAELNRALQDSLDAEQFLSQLRKNHDLLRALAEEILARARADVPGLDESSLRKLLGPSAGVQSRLLFPAAA